MNEYPADESALPDESAQPDASSALAPLTDDTPALAAPDSVAPPEVFVDDSEPIDQWLDSSSNGVLANVGDDAEPGFDLPKLHKLLADLGIGSRREMEELVIAGRVSVNGVPAHVGQRISPTDQIKVNGKPIRVNLQPPPVRVLAYHKPAGEIVTKSDPQQRVTVFKNLPRVRMGRWITVGRLDVATEGLLLFTTSGELANRLMHPRNEIEREYTVRVFGQVEDHHLEALRQGVMLDDGPAKFDSVEFAGGEGANQWVRVTLKEGRNREVRRVFEAIGLVVSRLIRIRYGGIQLPPVLRRGQSADLSEGAVTALMESVGLKPRNPAAGAAAGKTSLGKGKRARASFGLPEMPISMAVVDRSSDHYDDEWTGPGHDDDDWQPASADAHLSQLAGPVKKKQGARKPNPMQTTWGGAQKPSHGGLSAPQRSAKPARGPKGAGGPSKGPFDKPASGRPGSRPGSKPGGRPDGRPARPAAEGGFPSATADGQAPRPAHAKRPPRKPRVAGGAEGYSPAADRPVGAPPRGPRPSKPRAAASGGGSEGAARPPRGRRPRGPRAGGAKPSDGGPQEP